MYPYNYNFVSCGVCTIIRQQKGLDIVHYEMDKLNQLDVPCMLQLAAISSASSTSTFTKMTFGFAAAISSITGDIILHGPHLYKFTSQI